MVKYLGSPSLVKVEWHQLPLRLLESGTQNILDVLGSFSSTSSGRVAPFATTFTGKRNPVPFLMCWVPLSSTSSGRVAPFGTTCTGKQNPVPFWMCWVPFSSTSSGRVAPFATTFTGKWNPVPIWMCWPFLFPAQVVEEWHHLALLVLESGTQFHS